MTTHSDREKIKGGGECFLKKKGLHVFDDARVATAERNIISKSIGGVGCGGAGKRYKPKTGYIEI